MIDKLKYLIDNCKCGVTITINDHKTMYQTVTEYLNDLVKNLDANIDDNDRFEMIQRDTVIEIQLFPSTPRISYEILHYDLDMALDEAINILNNT